MQRRTFIKAAASSAGATMAFFNSSTARDIDPIRTKAYLRSIVPSRERIEQFTRVMNPEESMQQSNGWTYDSDLGWVHCDAFHSNGVNRSKTFYHYEPDGARKITHFPDTPCRIHAYGNSFTHCDQVNDGETWEAYLAAHLQEPLRNYGVGGYSVYQAYRRMLKTERRDGAEYIILNIWDDDHYRNLDAWRSIRFGQGSACGFTLPHLRVDVKNNRCEPKENLLKTRTDVFKLLDEDFLWQSFKDDPILRLVLAVRSKETVSTKLVNPVAVGFGIPNEIIANTELARQIQKIHTEAALFATKNIVTWTEDFIRKTGKKLMILLSFGKGNIARELQGKPRFDQTFVDWLENKPYPVIDLRDIYRHEYGQYKPNVNTFLKRFFNGHHTPAGNFFMAWALKDHLVKWLDPVPMPYR